MKILLSLISGLVGALLGAILAGRSNRRIQLIDAYADFLSSAHDFFEISSEFYGILSGTSDYSGDEATRLRELEEKLYVADGQFFRDYTKVMIMDSSKKRLNLVNAMKQLLYVKNASEDGPEAVTMETLKKRHAEYYARHADFIKTRNRIVRLVRNRTLL